MEKNILNNLELITKIPVISSKEHYLMDFIIKNLAKNIKWQVDIKGNLICKKGNNPQKLAVIAHMDRKGFLVVGKTSKYLNVVSTRKLKTFPKGEISKVGIINSAGRQFNGVLKNLSKITNNLKIYESSTKDINLGDFAFYLDKFQIKKDLIISPNLDNSIGVLIALQLINEISNGTIIFSALEEIGFQGIAEAIHNAKPKQVIVLDTTYENQNLSIGTNLEVGSGVTICIKDQVFGDQKMVKELIAIAKSQKISHQIEIWEQATSDLLGLQNQYNLRSCFVGVAIKNTGTNKETVSLKDILSTKKLLIEYFKKYGN